MDTLVLERLSQSNQLWLHPPGQFLAQNSAAHFGVVLQQQSLQQETGKVKRWIRLFQLSGQLFLGHFKQLGKLDELRRLLDFPNLTYGGQQIVNADMFVGLSRNHGNVKLPRELLQIDLHPLSIRQVHHVQGDDDRNLQIQKLTQQIQIPLEIAGVQNAYHTVWRKFTRLLPQKHIHSHPFIRRPWNQTVGSRQIDPFDRKTFMLAEANALLNGHTRVIARPLMDAAEPREKCRFPRIRVSNQRDP